MIYCVGNECHGIGADALKRAILSHCALEGDSGIRDLDISSNPLGNVGIGLLNGAFIRSQTLTSLNVSYCQIDNEGIVGLQEALAANPYIVKLDVHDNPITTNNEIKTLAEAAVNRYMVSLAKDPHAVNASKITHVVRFIFEILRRSGGQMISFIGRLVCLIYRSIWHWQRS